MGDVAKIMTGGKALARAAQDDETHASKVFLDGSQMSVEFNKDFDVKRVEFFGPVQRQCREAVAVFAQHQIGHEFLPDLYRRFRLSVASADAAIERVDYAACVDRKCVVQGKRVSVRVDLGCSSRIKKKRK